MLGLDLSTAKLRTQLNASNIYDITFDSVLDISVSSGITKLTNDVLFQILSKYDPQTAMGSRFRDFVAAPILYDTDDLRAQINIVEELALVEARFKSSQVSSLQEIPRDELLVSITLESIVVDKENNSLLLGVSIVNGLNQKAYISV